MTLAPGGLDRPANPPHVRKGRMVGPWLRNGCNCLGRLFPLDVVSTDTTEVSKAFREISLTEATGIRYRFGLVRNIPFYELLGNRYKILNCDVRSDRL